MFLVFTEMESTTRLDSLHMDGPVGAVRAEHAPLFGDVLRYDAGLYAEQRSARVAATAAIPYILCILCIEIQGSEGERAETRQIDIHRRARSRQVGLTRRVSCRASLLTSCRTAVVNARTTACR
jgi:hypothetical protein